MIEHIDECSVFIPSLKELRASFADFVEAREASCLSSGVCKITPPPAWFSSTAEAKKLDLDRKILPSNQTFTLDSGATGTYKAEIASGHTTTVRGFASERPDLKAKLESLERSGSVADFERQYWKSLAGGTVQYGSDIAGTLFDESVQHWNVATLDSCLSRGLSSEGGHHQVPGVNTPYLYYGKWRSTFAWHTEDMDLHSVNYLHYGAPKIWYCVAPADKDRVDKVFRDKLGDKDASKCSEFMRHKKFHMKPSVLEAKGITVHRVVQNPGDFIVTFPGAYHAGFNCGFNCAESTNFATPAWIKHGACANVCQCVPDSVRIDMGLFLGLAPNQETRQLIRARMKVHKGDSDAHSGCNSALGRAGSSGSVQESSSTQQSKAAVRKGVTASKTVQAYSKAKSKHSLDAVPLPELSRKKQVQNMKAAKRAQHSSAQQPKEAKHKSTPKRHGKVNAGDSPKYSSASTPLTALPSPAHLHGKQTRNLTQGSALVPSAQHGTHPAKHAQHVSAQHASAQQSSAQQASAQHASAQHAARQSPVKKTTAQAEMPLQPQTTSEKPQPKRRASLGLTDVLRSTIAGIKQIGADGTAMLLRSRTVSRPTSAEQSPQCQQQNPARQAGQLQQQLGQMQQQSGYAEQAGQGQRQGVERYAGQGQLQQQPGHVREAVQSGAGQPGHHAEATVFETRQPEGNSPSQQPAKGQLVGTPTARRGGLQKGVGSGRPGSSQQQPAEATEAKRRSKRKAREREEPLPDEACSDVLLWQGRRKVQRTATARTQGDLSPLSFRMLQAEGHGGVRKMQQ